MIWEFLGYVVLSVVVASIVVGVLFLSHFCDRGF